MLPGRVRCRYLALVKKNRKEFRGARTPLAVLRSRVALDVTAPRVAVMRRAARAARAVSVARAMNLALDDDAVAVIAVVAVHEHGEDSGDEEEDDVPVLNISNHVFAKQRTD
jgi:hypothetical protein